MSIPFKIFPVGSNKRPLVTGWQEKATRDPKVIARWKSQGVKAWGIPTGSQNNLFVIDLDTDDNTGKKVGENHLRKHERYSHLIDLINVRTPSGGAHIYFQHFDGARNSQSKIGPKIDTRGKGGYVIAPGSIVGGGSYTGHFPDDLKPVPMGLKAILLRRPAPSKKRLPDRPINLAEVREILTYIPADVEYDEWYTVLMGLHDHFNGSNQGMGVADEWSSQGVKYIPGEVVSKWRGFKRKGITFSSVTAIARKYGADLSEISRRHRALEGFAA